MIAKFPATASVAVMNLQRARLAWQDAAARHADLEAALQAASAKVAAAARTIRDLSRYRTSPAFYSAGFDDALDDARRALDELEGQRMTFLGRLSDLEIEVEYAALDLQEANERAGAMLAGGVR